MLLIRVIIEHSVTEVHRTASCLRG